MLPGTSQPPRATARMKLLIPRADGSGYFMACDFELSAEGKLRWRAATKAEVGERAVVIRVRRRGEAALGIFLNDSNEVTSVADAAAADGILQVTDAAPHLGSPSTPPLTPPFPACSMTACSRWTASL